MMLRTSFPTFALVLLFLMAGLARPAQAALKAGDALPLFELPLLSDTRPEPARASLGELLQPKSGPAPKAVLVVFFASYCQPCKDEFPVWQRLYATYNPQGLALVVVDADNAEESIALSRSFIGAQNPSFPVVNDRLALVSSRYFNEQEASLPSAFLADGAGRILEAYIGSEVVPERIETRLKEQLAAKAPILPSSPKKAENLMVWRLERKSDLVKDEEIDSLSGILIADLGRVSGRGVVSEYDVRSMLKKEEAVQRCGAQNTTRSCMLEIGGALALPESVSGDLGRIGDTWIFNLRLTNLRNSESGGRASRQIEGTLDDVMEHIPGMVAEIFGKPIPPIPATLSISSQPKGALVFDGTTKLGPTPLKKRVEAGEHDLTFTAPGYLPAKRHLNLTSGAKEKLEISLEKRPLNTFMVAGHASFWPGLALAGLGGVFVWQSKAQADERRKALEQGRYPAADSAHKRSKTYGALGITSLTLGGAAMIGGVVLWAIAPKDDANAKDESTSLSFVPSEKGALFVAQGRF